MQTKKRVYSYYDKQHTAHILHHSIGQTWEEGRGIGEPLCVNSSQSSSESFTHSRTSLFGGNLCGSGVREWLGDDLLWTRGASVM